MLYRLRGSVMAAVVVVSTAPASTALAQTVACTGVPSWNATTIYNPGDRVVYAGKLYQANVPIWNTAPDYCPSCGWYSLLGTCGGGGTDTTPPSVPTGLTSPSKTSTSVSLSWNASTDNSGGSGLAGYDVFRNGTLAGSPTGTSFTVTGLTANTTYSFTVRSRDNAGNASAQSAALSVTTNPAAGCSTLPSVPTGLTSPSKTSTSVGLSWNASSPGANCTVQYRVFRNGTQATQTSSTSFTDGGRQPGTTYSYTVGALNEFGSSAQSAALSVTTDPSGGGGCSGVPAWNPTTTYNAGSRVSYQGSLYEALSTTTNVPPNYCPSCGWWRLVGPCSAGNPPTVSITSPANGASFNQGATINIAASASDSDGNVTRVEFFANGGKIGEDTTSPYAFAWSGAASGSHQLTARATDNSGDTATSAAVGITVNCTGNCGGGDLPRHVITGYWHNFNNGSTVLKLRNVPAAYNLIAVAFADATGTPGAVTFNLDSSTGYSGNAEFISDIDAIHAQGRKVIISVGGQNGTVAVNSSTAATNFANSIIGLMNQYHFAGVDIDLENGLNAQFMGQALRAVAAAKPGAVITMAPQTIDMQSTGREYFRLALDIRDILSIVNMQYYNSGTMLGCDGGVYGQGTENFLTALACIQLQNGLRPDQVGLGLPATPSAAGGGYVSPSVVNAALDCLAAGTNCGSFRPPRTWPGIRGAMTWSINWDATNGYSWVNTISAHLPSVP